MHQVIQFLTPHYLKKLGTKTTSFLRAGIRVQLLMTAVSLPILIAWGLPVSSMSIVGNLLATPFLLGLLFLNSILFVTEMFSIPNQIFYTATNYASHLWHYLLSFGKQSWLIGLNAPPPVINLAICSGITVFIYISIKRYKVSVEKTSIAAMAICIGFSLIFQNSYPNDLEKIHCIARNQKQIVIDTGFFAYKTNFQSPIRYKIKPLLYKFFGNHRINQWHSTYAGIRTLKALCEVLEEIKIEKITFTVLPKKRDAAWNNAWHMLENKSLLKKTTLIKPPVPVCQPEAQKKKTFQGNPRQKQTYALQLKSES